MDTTEQSITARSTITEQAAGSGAASIPAPILRVRDTAITPFVKRLADMLAACDQHFFNLAEKAHNNSEQNMFFEAVQEIRAQRAGVQKQFTQAYLQSFAVMTGARAQAFTTTTQTLEDSELSLIHSEEMEQTVAMTSIFTKAREDNKGQLHFLARRFNELLPSSRVDESNNALDPKQLCQDFASATRQLDIDVRARVALFRQFDLFIISELGPILEEANQHLVTAGVLPKAGLHVKKYAPGPEKKPAVNQAIAEPLSAANYPIQGFSRDFAELRQMLSGARELALTGDLDFPLFVSRGHGAPMNNAELLSVLHDIQEKIILRWSADNLDLQRLDLRLLLPPALKERARDGKKTKVAKTDEDVINLIAMFFDFVLDDKQLPIQVQALVSRLQIPVLKMALRDKSFFSDREHPVRVLINEIVAAGIGLEAKTGKRKDLLLEKITEVVHDIHSHYDSDEHVFSTGLEILRTYRQREEGRAEKIERRTSETAEAQAKTQHTREIIKALVLDRLEGIETPTAIQEFAINEWQKLLLLTRLKYGEESTQWIDAVQTLDDLVWSAIEHQDEKSADRLERLLPDLQRRLRKQMSLVHATEEDAQQALQAVFDYHEQALNVTSEDPTPTRSKLDGHGLEQLSPGEDYEKPWREMTALERQQMQFEALTYDYIQKAEKIPLGSWVLFENSDAPAIRAKLAARIEDNDSYVFVNRMGFKVFEKKRREFAQNLQDGRARLIYHEMFFDRIMNKVTERLHSPAEEAAPA